MIAVVSVASLEADPAQAAPKGRDEEVKKLIFQQPSRGTFTLIRKIKGECPDRFDLQLPFLSSYYYARRASFEFATGTRVLLLLKRGDAGDLRPVDDRMPLVPLAAKAEPKSASPEKSPDALDYVLASLADDKLRTTLAVGSGKRGGSPVHCGVAAIG